MLVWVRLTSNPNEISLIKENKELIDWDYLTENPNAIHLLQHPSIFGK